MSPQFQTHFNWPLYLRLGGPNGFAYLRLINDRWLQWNLEPDADERIEWSFGRLCITRLETAEEEEERLDAEMEDLAMEAEASRYIDWSY